MFELLADLATNGTTVVFITHDTHYADRADRVVEMLDEEITTVGPAEAVGYTASEIGGDADSRPFR